MFCRNITSFICIFVAGVIATVQNDSHSMTGSDLEVTAYPFTSESPESSTREPDQQVMESIAVDLSNLLDAGDGAFVTLVTGDTRLAAHKAVLTARSPVFAETLERMTLEANSGQLVIPDLEGPVLRHLLAYMYTLQAPQVPDIAPQLLVAADTYGLSALKAHCEQQVAAQLSVENAVAAALVAVRHSCSSLTQTAITFIRTHIFHVMATRGWADAMNSQPEDLVKVIHLLSDPPAEISSPAPAASGATPTTEAASDHSDHSGPTPASAATTTAACHTSTPDYTNVCPLCVPATGGSGATPTTQPHSDRSCHSGRAPVSAVQPTTSLSTFPPDDAVSSSGAPATADSGATSTTQPPSDHSDHSGPTPASAATTTAARHTPTPDYAAVSPLWSVSEEEKNRRLIEVAEKGTVEEVEALLAAGADVRAADEYRLTALHYAATEGHVEVARRLLAAGAAVEARDRFWQWTPLHVAASRGHGAVVRLLVEEASADPNARSWTARTPLHYAAWSGRAEVAAVLLQAGADRGATDNKGQTPLDIARERNHQQLIDILS